VTAAGISVLSAAAVVVVGMGGGPGTRSLEWLVVAGSGTVISKPSATNKFNGRLRPPSTELGSLVVYRLATTHAAAAADESVKS